MDTKQAVTIRLSGEAKRLLIELAQRLGISQTAVLELAVRRLAKLEEVE